jgi:hypothetical protein
MIKLVEVSQKITFEASQNIRSTTVAVPWTAVVVIAVVGPLVVSAFRRPVTSVAPVTNLFSVPTVEEKPADVETENKDI